MQPEKNNDSNGSKVIPSKAAWEFDLERIKDTLVNSERVGWNEAVAIVAGLFGWLDSSMVLQMLAAREYSSADMAEENQSRVLAEAIFPRIVTELKDKLTLALDQIDKIAGNPGELESATLLLNKVKTEVISYEDTDVDEVVRRISENPIVDILKLVQGDLPPNDLIDEIYQLCYQMNMLATMYLPYAEVK